MFSIKYLLLATAIMLVSMSFGETYYLARQDQDGGTSMAGTGDAKCGGWKLSGESAASATAATEGNDYVVDDAGWRLRTPGGAAYTFLGDSLTIGGSTQPQLLLQLNNGGTLNIPSLKVNGRAKLYQANQNCDTKVTGNLEITAEGELEFDIDDGGVRRIDLASTITGSGKIIIGGGKSTSQSALGGYCRLSGSMDGFTGKLVVNANGKSSDFNVLAGLPMPTDSLCEDQVTLNNGASVVFTNSVTRGENLGVALNGDVYIEVWPNETVELSGPIVGSNLRIVKSGEGTLTLNNASKSLIAQISVNAGTLNYACENVSVFTSGSGVANYIGKEVEAKVMYVSPDGQNVSPYDTIEKAAKTVDATVMMAQSGDKIIVASGNYNPNSRLAVPSGVTIEGPGDRSARISGQGIDVRGEISGFTIENYPVSTSGGSALRIFPKAVVSNCYVSAGANPVLMTGGTLVASRFDGYTDSYAVALGEESEGPFVIRKNKFTGGRLSVGQGNLSSATIVDRANLMNLKFLIDECEFSDIENSVGYSAACVLMCPILQKHHMIGLNRCVVSNCSARVAIARGGDGQGYNEIFATNCLFVANQAVDSASQGTALRLFYARGSFINCTFADNKGDILDGGHINADGVYNCVFYNNDGATLSADSAINICGRRFHYSIFPEAGTGPYTDSSNLSTNGLEMMGRGKRKYALKLETPGSRAGTLTHIPDESTKETTIWTEDDVDLLGHPRLTKGLVDMGCYQNDSFGMMIIVR